MAHKGQPNNVFPYGANVKIDVRRRAAAPDTFIVFVDELAQRYLRARHGIPTNVPGSYLADLWHVPIDVAVESAWLAGKITPTNVTQVVELLFEPVIAWYQQQYYLNRGVGHLLVPREPGIASLYSQLTPEVKALYRRDANLMICANVLDDFLTMFVRGPADSFNSLQLNYDAENWFDLERLFTALYTTITTGLFPLLESETDHV